MISFKKILCPIDYSDSSFNVLKYAIEMTIKDSAMLYLMYVADENVFDSGGLKFETELSPDSETIAGMEKKLMNNIPQKIQHLIKAETLIRVGAPVDVILKVAHDKKAYLIVMGTHGRTGITQKIISSVTERVIRNAPCPVLCIRNY